VKRYLLVACYLLLPIMLCAGSNDTLKQRGYLIYVGLNFFFQPCLDTTKDVYGSLNSASFRINYGRNGFNNILYSMRDSIDAMALPEISYIMSSGEKYLSNIFYVYCELEFRNIFNDNRNRHPCMFTLIVDNREYSLGCFSCDVEVLGLRPLK